MMPRVGLQSVIVAFPGHTHLPFTWSFFCMCVFFIFIIAFMYGLVHDVETIHGMS